MAYERVKPTYVYNTRGTNVWVIRPFIRPQLRNRYFQLYAGMVPPLVYERFNIIFCLTLIRHRRCNPRCWQIRKLHYVTCLIISAVGLYEHQYRRAL